MSATDAGATMNAPKKVAGRRANAPGPAQEVEAPMHAQRSVKRAYGSGSIYEHHGSWYGRWRPQPGVPQLKRKLGPKRSRGGSDGLTRVEAEARLRELMAAEATSAATAARQAGGYTVAQLGELYIENARKRGLKDSTLTDYAMCIRVHLAPFFGDTQIRRISAKRIESLIVELQHGGLRPKSVRNYVGTLSTLLNFAVRKKWLAANPMSAVDLPALTSGDEVDDPLQFLLPHEVHALANATKPGLYHAIDRALYLTAAFTGLRQGELRGLLWQHVDFDASRVRAFENVVRGKRTSPKSRRGRSVPTARTVAHALLTVRAGSSWTRPHDPVFADPVTGRPIARTPLMRRYRAALTAAGLDPEFRFHDLRHTFGTSMARAGEPVTTIQAWLGHGDLKTTQRYMHYAPAADEAERVERAFAIDDNDEGTSWPRGTVAS
jgi:integrase